MKSSWGWTAGGIYPTGTMNFMVIYLWWAHWRHTNVWRHLRSSMGESISWLSEKKNMRNRKVWVLTARICLIITALGVCWHGSCFQFTSMKMTKMMQQEQTNLATKGHKPTGERRHIVTFRRGQCGGILKMMIFFLSDRALSSCWTMFWWRISLMKVECVQFGCSRWFQIINLEATSALWLNSLYCRTLSPHQITSKIWEGEDGERIWMKALRYKTAGLQRGN